MLFRSHLTSHLPTMTWYHPITLEIATAIVISALHKYWKNFHPTASPSAATSILISPLSYLVSNFNFLGGERSE